MELEDYFEKNRKCYDRFTFDNIFRYLLSLDYLVEEAKDLILFNCSLSSIVFQERIDNGFYKEITTENKISKDLQELKKELFKSNFPIHYLN